MHPPLDALKSVYSNKTVKDRERKDSCRRHLVSEWNSKASLDKSDGDPGHFHGPSFCIKTQIEIPTYGSRQSPSRTPPLRV